MEAILPLIIQAVAGAAGGGGIAAAIKQIAVNKGLAMLMGAVGGVGGGFLAPLLGLATGDAGTGMDAGALIGSVVSGGAGGAVLTGILGSIMGGAKS